ncbi:hypothetical protein ABG067_001434 [Albugo candida]
MSTTSDSDTSSSSSSDSSTSSSDEDNVDVSHTKLGAVEMQTNSPVSEPTPYNSDVRIQTILQAQSAIAPLLKLEALYAQDKKKLVESRLRNGDIPALNTMKCKRLAPFIPDDSIQREKLLDTEYLDEEDAEEQEMARSTADECEADEMETMHMIGEEEAKSEDSDGFDDDAEAVLHEEIMQARKDGMFEFGIDIPTKIIDYPYPDYLIRAAAMMTKENVFGKHPQKFVYCNNLMISPKQWNKLERDTVSAEKQLFEKRKEAEAVALAIEKKKIQEKVAAELAQTLKQLEDGQDQNSDKNACNDDQGMKELTPDKLKEKPTMKVSSIAVEFSGKHTKPQKSISSIGKKRAIPCDSTSICNKVQKSSNIAGSEITKSDNEQPSVVSISRPSSSSSSSSSSMVDDDSSTSTSDDEVEM